MDSKKEERVEFVSPWVVVATGENGEPVVGEVKGREGFKGGMMHSSEYRSGKGFEEKKVLVVGCGNSGMEICLDLCEHGALPYMSVRSGVSFFLFPPNLALAIPISHIPTTESNSKKMFFLRYN